MPMRRGLRAGLSAGFGSVAESANAYGSELRQIRQQERAAGFAAAKDVSDKIAAGTLDLEQGVAMLKNYGFSEANARASLSGVQPTIQSQLGRIVGGFDKATSMNEVPTNEALNLTRPSRVGAMVASN